MWNISTNKNKIIITSVITILLLVLVSVFLVSKISAQGVCDFFPCGPSGQVPLPGDTSMEIEDWFRFGTSIIFTGFITVGIVMVVRGVLKIVRSEGDAGQLEEGTKVFKGVFIGVLILIVGVIGLVIVLAIFNGQGLVNTDINTPEGVDNLPIL